MITKGKWYWEYNQNGLPFNLRSIDNRRGYESDDHILFIGNDCLGDFSFIEAKDNAEFIVSACNACKSINEEHPELVAQNIKEMYEALIMLYDWAWSGHVPNDEAKETADSVLSKIKGGELK